ncbi:Sugar lactone lactonase YvrE [Enhydrobacter aerosaccus]|uniref:Sugar lactone lactonase YvrE n=1 Tax=Enhydrobacter aerosaccus TaxID=225324 RepID=A0A1T4T754_9HYPH|nr:SMP-30/gluconolactonase/LRE family protein [Enhydrobacter aerosaccus]SKA36169.1 Sugar lactone lactonase YvrE [Enhydrobacter aerosaccus]
MRPIETRTPLNEPLDLAEGPVWDDMLGMLWFVDITQQLILQLDPDSGALRRFPMPAQVGSLGLATNGRLVVALRSGVHLFDPNTSELEFLVNPEPTPTTNRLNDGKVGPDGNFWVGSLDGRPTRERVAALYRITPEGTSTRIVGGLYCSNGLAWSPDGRTMYHADTLGSYVQVFDFDPRSGQARNPRKLLTLDRAQGLPDGGAVDVEGHYWSAGISAGVINRISPDGVIVERIPLPVTAPTMPCFGGPDMRTVFVTALASDRSGTYQAGSVVSFRVEVPGLPACRFGERIPA